MKRILLLLLISLPLFPLAAFDASVDVSFNYDIDAQNSFYQYGVLDIGHTTEYIDFFWSFSVCNDDKYQPSHGDDLFFGYYFFIENGGFALNYNSLSLTLGRTALTDMVGSPYSLFVSSKIIPALTADISFDDGRFFYTSRWTELNRDSALYRIQTLLTGTVVVSDETVSVTETAPLDRGWQYNTYGLYIGDFRLGFQDSLIYTGRSFDIEYFLNPLPGFFRQYTRVSGGKPWQVAGNDNSIMGFFVDWNPGSAYAYTQILIDDFNANAIFNPDSFQNPNKIAWSLGGRYDFDFGTLGLYNAGATKYTFQSSGSTTEDYNYGYSFYPASTYTANGVIMPIEPEDTYIGYFNGENNLSFLADYEAEWFDIGIYSSLEFSLSGTKSPANAWSEYSWWTEVPDAGTQFLETDLLEKKLVLTAGASRALSEFGLDNLLISLALEVGYIWNALELTDTRVEDVNQEQYWAPSLNNKPVFSISLGALYRI